jgi:hypothetical protein
VRTKEFNRKRGRPWVVNAFRSFNRRRPIRIRRINRCSRVSPKLWKKKRMMQLMKKTVDSKITKRARSYAQKRRRRAVVTSLNVLKGLLGLRNR